jgi:predicted RNA binding protein YcfA (HicA-like mRNA interferase family)
MRHHQKRGQVTVPKHAKKDIHPSTLKSILEQAGVTEEEFIKLLRKG